MKKVLIKMVLLCYVFFGSSLPASAAVVTFIGDFDATFNNPTSGIPNLTGSWSFDFDTNNVQGSLFIETFTVNLTSLTLSPVFLMRYTVRRKSSTTLLNEMLSYLITVRWSFVLELTSVTLSKRKIASTVMESTLQLG